MFRCRELELSIFIIFIYWDITTSSTLSGEIEQSRNNSCHCDWRYLKHYETKNCKPIYDENSQCNCPKRFQCSKLKIDSQECQLNGETYRLHTKVNTSNPCELCYCRRDFNNGKASIQCAAVDCRPLVSKPSQGCYLAFENGRCCPIEKCDATTTKSTQKPKVCLHNEKEYKIGQKIYSEADPCLICHCTENWTGMNNQSCSYFNCDLEKDIHKLTKGCIPIYHDKTCCPIEYHCPSSSSEDENEEPGYEGPDLCQEEPVFGSCHESFTRYYYNSRKGTCEEFLFSGCKGNRNNFASPAECEAVCGSGRRVIDDVNKKANMCYFDHRFYSVGDIMDIQHPTNCVTCTCQIPPDFTCVHRSCPGPPYNDYENCRAIYKENACCADYNCTTTVSQEAISPSESGSDGDVEFYANNCPPLNCPAPLCTKLVSPDECPKCECTTPVCVPPKCPEGCTVERNVPEGRCPSCDCIQSTTATSVANTLGVTSNPACPPLNCPEQSCRVIERVGKCPSCECGGQYLCAEPVCEPGCQVEAEVTDRCPGCRCNAKATVAQRRTRQTTCLTPICHPGCHIVSKNDGCLTCKCEQCIPPKCICPTTVCEEGCHLDRNVSYGQCPVCVCTRGGLVGLRGTRCTVPPCNAANCKLVSEEDGCLKCKCDDLCLPPRCFCSKPICNDGCEIDTDVRDGRCPGCKCKPSSFIAAAPRPTQPPKVLCPPAHRCDGPNCQLMLNQEGCAYCECKSVTRTCSVDSCPSNCKLEMHPSNGECPVCVCKFDKEDEEREYETVSRQNLQPNSGNSDRRTQVCPILNCPDCRKVTDSSGCQQCDCNRPISKPTTQRPVTRRPNPIVTTSTTTVPACPEEVCQGPYCRSVLGDDGCPTCQCSNPTSEQCTRPDCPSTCALKNKPGECPVCTCPTRSPPLDRSNGGSGRQPDRSTSDPVRQPDRTNSGSGRQPDRSASDPVRQPDRTNSGSGYQPSRTCPDESCHGIKCRLIPADNGCQKCVCEEPCRPLTCEKRCRKIENPANGKCPYCLCNF